MKILFDKNKLLLYNENNIKRKSAERLFFKTKKLKKNSRKKVE